MQQMALDNWQAGAEWFQAYLKTGEQPQEMWRAAIQASDCYFRMAAAETKDREKQQALVAEAGELARVAMDIMPQWADGALHLARSYCLGGEWEKALYWHEIGMAGEKPSSKVFVFDREYDFNPYIYSYEARMHLGDIEGALADVTEALKVMPDAKNMQERKAYCEGLLEQQGAAMAAVQLAQALPDEELLHYGDVLPAEVKRFRDVRDAVYTPVALLRDRGTQTRVDILCGQSLEPWAPPSLDEGGIGGSETAVIHVARLLAGKGMQVRVLGKPEHMEGVYDGVEYWDWERLPRNSRRDVLVYWRNPQAYGLLDAKKTVLWCHDLHYTEHLYGPQPFDRVCGVSNWHNEYLATTYPAIKDRLHVLRNGIDLTRYNNHVVRDMHRFIWSSSPDRGLAFLVSMMPYITAVDPLAKIHVYYGTQNIEKQAAANPDLREYLEQVNEMLTSPYVENHGRVDQRELALAQQSAGYWMYPTTFPEVSCITALEAQAAGLRIIASDVAALSETVNGGGYLIPGSAKHEMVMQRFVGLWAYGYENPDEVWLLKQREQQRANVNNQTWKNVVEEDWLPMIEELLQ